MNERIRNALIGLFVLIGLVCAGVLLILFGESQGLFQREYIVRAKFDTIRPPSIRQGSEVYLAGVLAGTVGGIELVDVRAPSKGMVARLNVNDRFIVPRGSIARVESLTLMGQPIVNIRPPAELIEPIEVLPRDGTAEIRGTVVGPLDNIIDPKMMAAVEKTTVQIGDLATALTPAANALTSLLEPRSIDELQSPEARIKGLTANITTAVERLYNVLTHFDTVLGDPNVQSNVKLALENFREASEGIKLAVADLKIFSEQARDVSTAARGTMEKVDQTVDLTKGHIDTLGRKLVADADQLSRVLDYFVSIGQQIAEGEGTAAMLLRDPKLYDELLLTFRRLGEAAAEMQVLIREWQAGGVGFRMK